MMKRKIFALVLAVLMAAMLPLQASADAYIPPVPAAGEYDILTAHEHNGICKPLNTYLSNFAEMGRRKYYLDTPDEDVAACILKHIELNAKYYPGDVSKRTLDDGKTYMVISDDLFQSRAAHLFGRDIPAESCPGYEDGYITVSADHYGGPIDIIANVNACYWAGDDLYEVFFDIYYIQTDFTGWYTTSYKNLPLDNLTHRGTGRAIVSYAGGETEDSISTSDFSLVEWEMDAWGIAGPGDNLPYGYVEQTEPPMAEDPMAEPETEAPTEAETVPETQPETEPAPTIAPENQKDDLPADAESAGGVSSTILIIALVCIAVLLAVVILLLIALKKKKNQ